MIHHTPYLFACGILGGSFPVTIWFRKPSPRPPLKSLFHVQRVVKIIWGAIEGGPQCRISIDKPIIFGLMSISSLLHVDFR